MVLVLSSIDVGYGLVWCFTALKPAKICFLLRLLTESSMRACDAVATARIGTAIILPCVKLGASRRV